MLPQQYCLRWKYHHSNLQTMFSQLLDRGSFCDVTLACEGQLIRAHRVVLCACSTFFDTVLSNYANERDPIIIIKDVTFADIRCLIEFMYKGEINVEHAHLPSLLKTADDLKIKGLAEVTWRDEDDRPTPPTPATEFYSPTREPIFPHDHHQLQHQQTHHNPATTHANSRASPPIPAHYEQRRRNEHRRSLTPPPLDARKLHALPTLTPIPTTSSNSTAAITATPIEYLGPKRKRGRPPLDDAYDVFNIRKLAHYASQMEQHQAYLESQQHYADEQRQQNGTRPLSPASAAAAYQQHIQQQQNKQRLRQRQKRLSSSSDHEQDEILNPGPEWITSNLEVNISEVPPQTLEKNTNENEIENDIDCKPLNLEDKSDEDESSRTKTTKRNEHKNRERSVEKNDQLLVAEQQRTVKRKLSQIEQPANATTPSTSAATTAASTSTPTATTTPTSTASTPPNNEHSAEPNDDCCSVSDKEETNENPETATVPRTIEDIENVNQALDSQRLLVHDSSSNHARSRQASPATSTSTHKRDSGSSSGNVGSSIPLPPPLPHPSHFGKFAPEGYMLNEHGMLMTHDSFIHATTANIPAAIAGGAAAAANGDPDFADIKMEDFDTADLRLTSEEMSQWQDVIKMDDYLAKGRRPQFWEEPFTRRVLDAIKNKRLEMKKAARILGVSYGTLYGRYREVYGCLKHPYSNSTGYRPSSSQLAVQPRFDMIWPPGKRDGSSMLPGPLDIGKLRPKDLTELWARPQL